MTRKTNLTAQIKPSTRNALADQFAAAADAIIRLTEQRDRAIATAKAWRDLAMAPPRPWWRRWLRR